MAEDDSGALEYHRLPHPGKIAVVATKPLGTQHDLALAYTPGVAAASLAIAHDPQEASSLTSRGNLVAVVTNGTAVLGLGAIGPLAAKPVMEGKAVLFKKFAGIDVFDIEIDERDPDRLVEVIAALEPTFGAINLEDVKAPECFAVEAALRARMKIPVFHDDQHGTAIIVGAAVRNALRLVGKRLGEVKLVTSGAGAAAIACLDLLVDMGLKVENVIATDKFGVVWRGRKEEMDPRKERYAKDTNARSLADVIGGADIFLGLSAPDVLKPDMLAKMAAKPIILALANPTPEIMPETARAVRPDAIIATGRSDYPNQVNNVLCFPFIFRGALDVGATAINEAMKLACVEALADLALAEPSDVVAAAYGETPLVFGPDYLIPKPFDPRLILQVAPAVARAATESGVATRPLADPVAYRQRLTEFVFRSGLAMKPVFDRARADPKRVIYAEGEDERVLRAAQQALDEGIAIPILVGRRGVVERRIAALNLRIALDKDIAVVDPTDNRRFEEHWRLYDTLVKSKDVAPHTALDGLPTRNTAAAALMLRRGEADAMLCGAVGDYHHHLAHLVAIVGLVRGAETPAALSVLITPKGTFFLCDTFVADPPNAEAVADRTLRAAAAVRLFGIEPKVALLSHSNFGSSDAASASRMREALEILRKRAPSLDVEGEMHADAALSPELRRRVFPASRLDGGANLLMMPSLDAANIAYSLLTVLGDGLSVGPILLGMNAPAHIVSPTITVRGLLNMTAVAVHDAQVAAAQIQT
jgi:malate dehydrogenase (oxaloacetate-decarboxylating)(NADP+)